MKTKTIKIKRDRRRMKTLSLLVATVSLLSACTKETPFQDAPKFNVENKSLIGSDEYLFTASTGQMSRTSPSSRPFAYAESKRVRLQLTEDYLQVLETEKDSRFKDNQTNEKLVIAIPIQHVDYKCAEDSFGECTNKEVEDTDKNWQQKGSFVPVAKETRSAQEDLLPINFEFRQNEENQTEDSGDLNSLGRFKCFTEFSSQLKSFKLEPDALNVTVTRHYRVDLMCLRGIDSLSDTTVSADFHYSMVKASSMVSPNYEVIKYPSKDQNTFGFFQTERTVLDVGNEATESGRVSVMNRWNPKRKEIVYHLTDNFFEKRNETILSLTQETVQSLNRGLQEAGVEFQIKLSDEKGKNPNDIRNTMIVLVEDPVAAGLLGYGPQTEDPLTGEIVSARTVMFLGTAIQSVRRTYEDLLLSRNELAAEAVAREATEGDQTPDRAQGAPRLGLNRLNIPALQKSLEGLAQRTAGTFQVSRTSQPGATALSSRTGGRGSSSLQNQGNLRHEIVRPALSEVRATIKDYTRNTTRRDSFETALEKYKYLKEAKHCEFFMPNDGVLNELSPQVLASLEGFNQPWEKLSEEQKQQVIALILPSIWVPTLIHELGHNLGLRHNFTGSEDKDNHFSAEELKSKGLSRKIPSSSVMEYIEDVRALPVLGKYDLAALRFGYLRKVETKEGQFVEVPRTLADSPALASEMKEFGFCTDEHVGINAGCRRFDRGTNNVEIVRHLIEQYESFYRVRNLRKDRAHFSLADDLAYASRIRSVFREMRLMFEVNERIVRSFRIPYNSELWKTEAFLKDLREAAVLAGDFLIQVATTPDQTCVFARADKPQEIIGVERLSVIAPRKDSCFEVKEEINPQFMPIAEFGKPHLSKKSSKSTNAYADQIDVRGIWIDKLMAINTLFERKVQSFNLDSQGADNFADLPELRGKLQELIISMAMNNVQVQTPVVFVDGSVQVTQVPVEIRESFKLPQMMAPIFSRILGIPETESRFVDWMVRRVPTLMLSHPSKEISERRFTDAFRVERRRTTEVNEANVPPDTLKAQLTSSDVFIAHPENLLARALFAEREETLKRSTDENKEEIQAEVDSVDQLIKSLLPH